MTAQEIKNIRLALGKSQSEFAALLGANGRSTVCNWESGIRSPDRYFTDKLKKLAKKLKVKS